MAEVVEDTHGRGLLSVRPSKAQSRTTVFTPSHVVVVQVINLNGILEKPNLIHSFNYLKP